MQWNEEVGLNHAQLTDLLKKFGDLLPAPLSQRVDLPAYASKLQDRADICCAFEGKPIVGLQAIYANDQRSLCGHIPLLAVLPSHQGKGLGKAMLSRALALARQRGMKRVGSEVNLENTRARRLYESAGFQAVRTEGASLHLQCSLPVLPEAGRHDVTPLQPAPRLAAALGIDIDLWLKRDDLYPMSGGGSKARKIEYIVRKAIAEGYDVLVTNGGPQSNHARATATIAANLGLRCHLVVALKPATVYRNCGNLLLMKLSGASIEYCKKEEIAEFMDRAVDGFAAKGHKPLYIRGGGHCVEGTIALVEAAQEAMQQCGDWQPDFLIAASGTGTTQAGFAIGYAGTPTRVIGISVARPKEQGREAIQTSMDDYFRKSGAPVRPVEVDFRDDWTDGGYEESSPELFQLIECAARAGFYFDPTYSGKALRGLVALVRRGEIKRHSRVLFWHTGGLLNLQAVNRYLDDPISL